MEKFIEMRILKVDGVSKLCVKCPSEFTHIITKHVGWKYIKKFDLYAFPLFSVIFLFSDPDITELVSYDEKVYSLLDRERNKLSLATDLVSGKTEPPEHAFLLRHQRVGSALADIYNKYALFMDTGTGKTLTALDIISKKGGKWLVIVPRPIIKTGWVADATDFYPDLRVAPFSTNYDKQKALSDILKSWGANPKVKETKLRMREKLAVLSDVIVVNPESLRQTLTFVFKLGVTFTGVIIDESTIIKTYGTKITSLAWKLADLPTTENFYILTGDPRPQSELDYFPQMYCIDTAILGSEFYRFRASYFNKHPHIEGKYLFDKSKANELAGRIAYKSYTVKKEECLDLPPAVDEVRMVELDKKSRAMYNQLFETFLVTIGDTTIAANKKTGMLIKLRQLLGGFVYDENHKPYPVSNAKLNELKNTLEEIGDRQVVIWISFREEAEIISRAFEKGRCVIANSEHDSDEALAKFMSAEAQYLIAHPASIKYGVTLTGRNMTKNCSYAVYYSKDKNYENYNQSKDRTHRFGQDEKVTNIHLVVEDTIDEDIHSTIGVKEELSDFFIHLIQKYSGG